MSPYKALTEEQVKLLPASQKQPFCSLVSGLSSKELEAVTACSPELKDLIQGSVLLCPPGSDKAGLQKSDVRLKVKGAKIFDHTGKEFRGRGMNWGKHSDQQLYVQEDFKEMKALMPWVNHVRVVFKWHTHANFDAYDPKAEGFLNKNILVYLDNIVKWGSEAKVWFVLTMTYNGGVEHLKAPYNKTKCTPFVTDPTWRAQHQAMWKFLIRRYAHVDYLAWVEPWSEAKMSGCNETQKLDWMNALVETVHSVEPELPVALAEHYNMCVGPKHWVKLNSDKVIYPVNYWMPAHGMDAEEPGHGYLTDSQCKHVWGFDQRTCFETCSNKKNAYKVTKDSYRELMSVPLAFQKKYQVPIWADQWGGVPSIPGMAAWITDLGELFEEYGFHSAWWTYKGASPMTIFGPRDLDCLTYKKYNSSITGLPYKYKSECQKDYDAYVVNALVVKLLNGVFNKYANVSAQTTPVTKKPPADGGHTCNIAKAQVCCVCIEASDGVTA